jgi:proteasome lid subunit RPN8/RPN11
MTALLSAGAAKAITVEIAAWGVRERETGGFLLSRPGIETLDVVALSGAAGIRRRADQYRVSPAALGQLFNYAAQGELVISAVFHSHRRSAFLSETDLAHGLNVEGLLSAVVPFYAEPPVAPACWRWWRFSGSWKEIEAPSIAECRARIVRFDEDGARES